MNKRTFKVDFTDDGAGGYLPVILDKSKIGFKPSDTMNSIQVSCTGLDAGTFTVEFAPVNAPHYIEYENTVTENSSVFLQNGFLADAVKISLANTGVNASPTTYVTFIQRGF